MRETKSLKHRTQGKICPAGYAGHIFFIFVINIYHIQCLRQKNGVYVLKSISNEIKRKLRAQTACINWTIVAVACGAAVILGVLFAINGVNFKLYKEMIKPACALPAWLIIPFFAIAICALTFSCVCVLSSRAKHLPKQQNLIYALYFTALALSYVWIPLTYKAAVFFASFIVCIIILAALCVIYALISRTEKLASAALLVFAVWIAYLTYLSLGLFFVN